MAAPRGAALMARRSAQGRAPLPRTYRAWTREQDGLRRFLATIDGYLPAYGQDWVNKMRAHYTARLKVLDSRPPPPPKPVRR